MVRLSDGRPAAWWWAGLQTATALLGRGLQDETASRACCVPPDVRLIPIIYYKNIFCSINYVQHIPLLGHTWPCFKIFCMVRIYSCLILWLESLAYRSLEAIWLCPKKSRIATTSAPCSRRFEANVCRKLQQSPARPAAL